MEINNQHLKIQPKNQNLNAKSMADQAESNIEQSQEYGKNLNFTGLRNMKIKKVSLTAIKKSIEDNKPLWKGKDKEFKEAYENVFPEMSDNIKFDEILNIAKENNLKAKSKRFLILMMQRAGFHAQHQNSLRINNKINPEEMTIDSPNVILDLFKRVKNPTHAHNEFVDSAYLSMTDVKKCFDACEDDAIKINKLSEVRKDVETSYIRNHSMYNSKESHDVFMDFVESPNLDEYLQNYENLYKGHILRGIRKQDNNVIKTLDKLHANKDKVIPASDMLKFEKAFEYLSKSAEGSMNPKHFMSYQSAEGDELLSTLADKFRPTKEYIQNNGDKDFVDIYKTTTKDNLQFRTDYLDKMYYNINFQEDVNPIEIKAVNKLFQITDENPKAQEFVQRVMDRGFKVNSSIDLVTLFAKHDPKILVMRSKGVLDLMNNRNQQIYVSKIDEFLKTTEPTLGERVSEFFNELFARKPKKVKVKTEKPVQQQTIESKYPEEYVIKPKHEEIKIAAEEIKPEHPVQQAVKEERPAEVKQTRKPFSLAEANKAKLLSIMTNSPSGTMSKKLKITQDSVSPILKKNIKSERVLNEQEYLYTINATKMRANMLPDIFESIKVTRAQAKAANGGKLPKDFVKNEDAINLYTEINGKNKKLVNYMLKQTKKDESGKIVKAFNVKDIIKTLEDANRETLNAKKLSTKENPFTSKDEKAIFDRMLGDLKAEYGELPKKPRVKKSK